LLEEGMTGGALAWLAAETEFNKININLSYFFIYLGYIIK
jgi:hypothetical protein